MYVFLSEPRLDRGIEIVLRLCGACTALFIFEIVVLLSRVVASMILTPTLVLASISTSRVVLIHTT